MDEYKLKDYTERLKKETNENAHKMLYMWIKQDIISLNEYRQLVLNLSLQNVSESDIIHECNKCMFDKKLGFCPKCDTDCYSH